MRRFVFALLLLAGCARTPVVRLPYSVETVPSAATPRHRLTLAVLPLEDARRGDEAPDDDGRFIYRDTEYDGTRLESLGLEPMGPITLAVARHLAKARVFERVLVVPSAAEAGAADLLLSGSLVRLRGYVEAHPPPEDTGLSDTKRRVVAEAMLGPFELRATPEGAALARFTVGWAFHDVRTATAAPWSVAAEALRPALDQLTAGLREATVDGSVGLEGALRSPGPEGEPSERLARAAPSGWRLQALEAGAPEGWRLGGTSGCERAAWISGQELAFTRSHGPLRPSVLLVWCDPGAELRFDARADRIATYVGRDDGGRRWFVEPRGPSVLKRAPEQLQDRFRLTPSELAHPFVLGPGDHESGPGGRRSVPAGLGR